MGYIRVREGRYQANVRRKGYAPVTKTFTSRDFAKRFFTSRSTMFKTSIYCSYRNGYAAGGNL